ncbi:MAG: hypothetical protein IGS48_04885 [Oscillatoriales cyanobacterium C42_A2020_001]|nr:hypothetical protein [Leptolyngbyaceae cyanobacterium C42_A2020_001]
MTQSNRVPRSPLNGYTFICSLLYGTAFLLVFCPEFVQTALQGTVKLSLISDGIGKRFKQVQSFLQEPGSFYETHAVPRSMHQLFGEAEKLGPGAIAIGNAEGTLTRTGKPTWAYYGHLDPANQVTNKGFASWQASPVKTVKEADQKAIHRIKTQCIPYTIQSFEAQGLTLTSRLLVESCDIWIQAPRAAVDFALNLKQCESRGEFGEDAILCARVKNYINPATGKFEVASIFRKPGALEADQQRRSAAIARALNHFKVPDVLR